MAEPITAEDIKRYLDNQNDFDLELFVRRTLLERGIPAHHSGAYVDSVTGKSRQYDIRATKLYPKTDSAIALAVECKSLSADFPLVVLGVSRPEEDSYHDVILSWGRPEMGEQFSRAVRLNHGPRLYPPADMVGKSTVQVRWDANKKSFIGGDAETYEKWSQALASAADLVRKACHAHAVHEKAFHTLVLPVLVVSDGALWGVNYGADGAENRRNPAPLEEVTLLVDREYPLVGAERYRISHLHICTRTGFVRFIDDLVKPRGTIWQHGIGQLIKQ